MPTKLIIENCFSHLITDDEKVLNVLWSCLRFRERNYFHNVRYKMRLWDGYTEFFKRETGKFLTGLLPEIRNALKQMNVPYETEDNRGVLKFTVDSVDDQWLNKFLQPGMKPVDLRDYQIEYINRIIRHSRGIVFAPTSAGKAQPLDSLVYTPSGPINMGDIKVGDLVCTPCGKTAKVMGVFPQGLKDVYRISFTNGDSVECCDEHLWKVDAIMDGWKGRIKDTNYLRNNLSTPSGRPKYRIVKNNGLNFKSIDLKLPPYLMGALLGDGGFRGGAVKFSNVDEEIIHEVRSSLFSEYSLKHDGKCDYRITKKTRKSSRISLYLEAIRKYGLDNKLSHEKFIPNDYKYNSVENRLELIRGLMDTDGYVSKSGQLEFSSSSNQMALDFKEVLQSLGVLCHFRSKTPNYTYKGVKKKGKRSYTVSFSPEGDTSKFCFLSRKKIRCKTKGEKGTNWVISKIEKVGKKECQCILIDSQEHLYVTDHGVPTHNTNILVGSLLALPPETPTLVLANRKSLVEQNYDEIRQWGFKNVGRFYGDHKEIKTIICTTIQSAHLLKKLFPKIKAIFIDEIHEMMSRKPRAVYNACKSACVRVGMSATPFKFGGKDKVQMYEVKGYVGPELIKKEERLTTKKLQDRGFLASVDCTFYPVHEPEIPYHVYMDAVTEGIANNQHLHDMTCKLVKSLTGRTLIIVERVSHGDQLHDLIPGSLWVRGQDDSDTRKSIIKKLKENKQDTVAIATSGIFNTGINVFVHNLINCAGGQAEHQIVQRFGRGLRVAEDKTHLKYFDWYFTINDYLGKHSEKRVDILTKEGHNVEVKECFDL